MAGGGTADNRSPTRWIVCGDFNTDPGVLQKLSSQYWANSAALSSGNDTLPLRVKVTKHHKSWESGDCAVSRGLFTLPVRSEIQRASDAHYMVILQGFFASISETFRSVPPPASTVSSSGVHTQLTPSSSQPLETSNAVQTPILPPQPIADPSKTARRAPPPARTEWRVMISPEALNDQMVKYSRNRQVNDSNGAVAQGFCAHA